MVTALSIMVGAIGQRVAVRRGCAGVAKRGELKFDKSVGTFSIGDMIIEPSSVNCVVVYSNPTGCPTTIIELYQEDN